MAGERWAGLSRTRTLLVEASFVTARGKTIKVPLTKREVVAVIADAASALVLIEHAEELNRLREALVASLAAEQAGDVP